MNNRKITIPVLVLILALFLGMLLAGCQQTATERAECRPVVVECSPCPDCDASASDAQPPAALGDAEPSGTTTFNNLSAGDLTLSDDLTVGDDATITDALTAADLIASDDLLVTDNLYVSGAVAITETLSAEDLASTDDASVADDLTVSGSATISESLSVTQTVSAATIAGADLTATDDVLVDDDIYVDGAVSITETLTVAGVMTGPAIGTENMRLPTIESAAVITSSDGAIWTVGASEVWYVSRVFCNVTTNFDCTGDDCTIEIGLTGGDIDGFLDLDDGELQTADAEISGLPTGWQGFGSTDTRGAFFAAGGGIVLANDTIDIKIEDNSDQSNPTAGAATCYVVYTRLQ